MPALACTRVTPDCGPCRPDVAEALHACWRRYAAAALSERGAALGTRPSAGPPAARLAERVAGLELTGARLGVARCRDARWAGAEGVVVRDAPGALHLLLAGGRVAAVSKRGSEFRLALGTGADAVLDGGALARGGGRRA